MGLNSSNVPDSFPLEMSYTKITQGFEKVGV